MGQKQLLWLIFALAIVVGYGAPRTLACHDSQGTFRVVRGEEVSCRSHTAKTTGAVGMEGNVTESNFAPSSSPFTPPNLLTALILLAIHFVFGIIHTWIREKRRK